MFGFVNMEQGDTELCKVHYPVPACAYTVADKLRAVLPHNMHAKPH